MNDMEGKLGRRVCKDIRKMKKKNERVRKGRRREKVRHGV